MPSGGFMICKASSRADAPIFVIMAQKESRGTASSKIDLSNFLTIAQERLGEKNFTK